jgi:hypothetical protein
LRFLSVPSSFILIPLFLSVFLIPVDSFPYFPVDSVYRPLAIFPLTGVIFYAIFSGRFNLLGVLVALFSLVVGLHSIATTLIYDHPTEHLPKSVITAVLLAIMLSAFSVIFNPRIVSPEIRRSILGSASFLALLATFSVVLIQFLSSSMGILQGVSNELTSLFSYRSVGRIQGLSGEPSQLIRNSMLIGTFSILLNRYTIRVISIGMCFFIVLVSGSTYGYLVIAIFIAIYILLFEIKAIANIKVLVALVVFSIFLSYFYSNHMGSYSKNKIDKVVEVLESPQSLVEVVEIDGSIFQRLMNPYIGFTSVGFDNVIGRGLDTYRYEYPDQILIHFPYALKFETVQNAVVGNNYITPKSLYSKVYFELGWLIFGLMLLSYLFLYFRVLRTRYESDKYMLRFGFCLVVVYPINTDSIIFFNYWILVMILVSSIYYRSRLF